ncbi:hypothetical protein Bca101_067154 [Brassica carinata]
MFILLQLKTARKAAAFGSTRVGLEAVSTTAFTWQYSRIPHETKLLFFLNVIPNFCVGTVNALSFLGGGLFGWTFRKEVTNHMMQLYKLDTVAAQVKFTEWWEIKSQGRS